MSESIDEFKEDVRKGHNGSFHFYSWGIAAANKKRKSDKLEITPTQDFPFTNDEVSSQQENNEPQHRLPRIGRKTLEGSDEIGRTLSGEAVGERFGDILERPSGHNGIIAEDEQSRQNSHSAHPSPVGFRCQYLISGSRVGA